MSAKTVFVIEQGQYSNYRVVGVYSTKELADAIAEKINAGNSYDEAEVAEWDLDPGTDCLVPGRSLWSVLMLRDGEVELINETDFSSHYLTGRCSIWERTKAGAYEGKNIPDVLHWIGWATDAGHAVKIANEQRTRMIASGEWA